MLSRIRVFPHVVGALFVTAVLAFATALLLGGSDPGGPARAGAHPGGVRAQPVGDPGPSARDTGDDRCPPRVAKPRIPKRADPKDRGPKNRHATKFDGPAPQIRWQDAPGGRICVTWTLPKETGGRVPRLVDVGIHAIYGLFPAIGGSFAPRRPGEEASTVLDLPKIDGPYEIVARMVWTNGRMSSEATAVVNR